MNKRTHQGLCFHWHYSHSSCFVVHFTEDYEEKEKYGVMMVYLDNSKSARSNKYIVAPRPLFDELRGVQERSFSLFVILTNKIERNLWRHMLYSLYLSHDKTLKNLNRGQERDYIFLSFYNCITQSSREREHL